MVARIIAWVAALFVLGCSIYVFATYALAFAGRDRGGARILRAALVELATTLLLLPLWPLWMIAGASYRAATEGEGEARGRRNPVILLHGYGMNRTNWVWLGRRLAKQGIGPLYGASYFSPQPVRESARHLQRFVERVLARERTDTVDIVAHSLGGVVARYYIERLGGGRHVGRLVTIASPHRGTLLGRFGVVGSAKELHCESPFIAELGQPAAGVAYTSVWSRADAVVVPACSASIEPAGEDVVFDDLGHLSLLLSGRVADIVAGRLRA